MHKYTKLYALTVTHKDTAYKFDVNMLLKFSNDIFNFRFVDSGLESIFSCFKIKPQIVINFLKVLG